jgi:hypothetical protein
MSTHAHEEVEIGLYGIMAEFTTPEALLAAARKVSEAGYTKVDAYSPFSVHGVDEALKAKTVLPWLIFCGGLSGGVGGFLMMVVANFHYKINIAGKPLVSWPSFMPITFELTVLCASATAVLGMLFLNGLPKPFNPVFNFEGFDRASQDRFFLCVEATDPQFDLDQTSRLLEALEPHSISEVPY